MVELDPDLAWYYGRGRERERLRQHGLGKLELLRTQDVLRRHLPAGGLILDVGGGPGEYAAWLAGHGYRVQLYDPVQLHIEQALALAASQPEAPFTAELADARSLPCPDLCADGVLLLGPLYHLPERGQRLRCLAEARRVLRPGAVLAVAAISRFASLIDGVRHDFLADPTFTRLAEEDLQRGQHRNPARGEGYFTSAYFHRPEELAQELTEAGFVAVHVCTVEGFAAAASDRDITDWLADAARAERLLTALRRVESEPSLLGATSHLLAIAHAPGA